MSYIFRQAVLTGAPPKLINAGGWVELHCGSCRRLGVTQRVQSRSEISPSLFRISFRTSAKIRTFCIKTDSKIQFIIKGRIRHCINRWVCA